MKRRDRDAGTDEYLRDALQRIEAFLAIVLAERAGPLTSLQQDLLTSASSAAARAERRVRDAEIIEHLASLPTGAAGAQRHRPAALP